MNTKARAQLAAPAEVLDGEPEWPEYHHVAMGCGLEDHGITDRYEAMQYGWDDAVERCAEAFSNWLAASPSPAPAIYQCPRCATSMQVDRTAKPATASGVAQVLRELLDWAVYRWHAEVSQRPLVNVHRRSLDDTWRQIIRHLGGDDIDLCGPTHDALLNGGRV